MDIAPGIVMGRYVGVGLVVWLTLSVNLAGSVSASPAPSPRKARPLQTGQASWYGEPHHGRRTASGEVFDMHELTAAHRTLPLGARVRVTNLRNGRSVEVRINDRGPFVDGRIIDVSYGAARALGAVGAGLFPVSLKVSR
jgi:rare lipoprotein A